MIYLPGAIALAIILAACAAVIGRRRRRGGSSATAAQVADVTIVFTNIIGFVSLFEREGDAAGVQIVNLFRETMTPIIRRYGGYLNKFIGDKMLIIFNTPINPDADHCQSAVSMILAMQSALDELNTRLENSKHGRLAISIGAASGHAVVGDAGTEGFADYTALGDVVNIAARLEKACKASGRKNLIGLETASRLEDRFALEAVAVDLTPHTPRLAYEASIKTPEPART